MRLIMALSKRKKANVVNDHKLLSQYNFLKQKWEIVKIRKFLNFKYMKSGNMLRWSCVSKSIPTREIEFLGKPIEKNSRFTWVIGLRDYLHLTQHLLVQIYLQYNMSYLQCEVCFVIEKKNM